MRPMDLESLQVIQYARIDAYSIGAKSWDVGRIARTIYLLLSIHSTQP